jgi:hypothetical protein
MRMRANEMGALLLVGLAGCSQCGDDPCETSDCIAAEDSMTSASEADSSGTDGPTTAGSEGTGDSSATDASTTTGEAPGQCQGNDDCADGEFCVAPYGNNVRGPFDCVSDCVGPMDEARWCYDDDACCDPQAHCTIRGYCEVDAGATTTDDGAAETDTGAMTTGTESTG